MISEELFKFIQSQGSYTGTIAGKIPKSGDRIILEKLIIRYENNSYDGDVAKFYEKIWNKNDMCTSKIDYYNRRGKCKSFNANKYTELYEWCLVAILIILNSPFGFVPISIKYLTISKLPTKHHSYNSVYLLALKDLHFPLRL